MTKTTTSTRYAAIDLGTNTCLLLVAEWDGQELHPLVREMRVVRLGENLDRTGRISSTALDRATAALTEYRDIITSSGCQEMRCVATSAFRDAPNKDELTERIRNITGLEIEEISGEEEARLVHRAVQEAFPEETGERASVDVGGGSTEIIFDKQGHLHEVHSLPLGSVRLTERHFSHDPPAAVEVAALRDNISTVLEDSGLPTKVASLIGVGGTATTLAAIHLELEDYDPVKVHGRILKQRDLETILERCLALPYEQRVRLPGLHPGRADVIMAGTIILLAIMGHLQDKMIRISDRGIRWGIIAEMIRSQGV